MKLIDCFMYFDEDLVLDIRLNTLKEKVDKFVIAEATKTHSGEPKKLNFNLKNFEFIFLDPPFKELRIKFLLNILKHKKICNKESIILIHRDKKNIDQFPKDFRIIIDKKYGRSRILFGKFY